MGKIKLEIENTGNHTANLILFFNEFLKYSKEKAGLSATGVNRLVSIFEESSRENQNDE